MKLLFITLSNIGDVILTLPALDALRACFPGAEITVVCGPRPKEIFQNNPFIHRLIVYDKQARLREKIKLFFALKKENFAVVVDLRNSLYGLLLAARQRRTLAFLKIPKIIEHMSQRHLYRLQKVTEGYCLSAEVSPEKTFWMSLEDKDYIENILKENNITQNDTLIVVASGARSHTKRWGADKFRELIRKLVEEFGAKVILVGDKDDLSVNKYICQNLWYPVVDLTAKTSISQLAYLLQRTRLLITNDSAVLHLASYLNVMVVALFGPTSESKYRPWSEKYAVVKKDIFCRPCQKAECRFDTLECLELIKVEDMLGAVRNILVPSHKSPLDCARGRQVTSRNYKRILIVRTDRIGDVLLSTPVIKALRDNYPHAYIAMMVSPYAKEIVEGNPYLDSIIIYDKEAKHRGLRQTLKFALNLKKKRFDLALILHPTNRVHLITFLASIKKRVGFDKKLGFLLTDRIKHTKQYGEKHELEYNLDLVRYLGIEPADKNLFLPLKPEAEAWAQNFLTEHKIIASDKLLAIHPGASCPSKIWPNERFAAVADRLAEEFKFKTILVAGPKDIAVAERVRRNMRQPALNLAGKLSVSQLASILKRCALFISNDSGPVHIASSVGTPVISIFGRNLPGLSPRRWGPRGEKDRVLHKEVGCIECLAHNCQKQFLCLKAVSVEDVVNATIDLLKTCVRI